MPTAPLSSATLPNRYGIPLFLALIVAGLAGNYFNFDIFLNINFLFGSIFAMLALQFFGLGRGIAAAAIIAGYTYILWNNPYAILIMTAEVATVGWLMGWRRKVGMVLADTLYWLIIGLPLAYLVYHFVVPLPPGNLHIIIIKLAVNGIANTLVARLIFTGFAIRLRSMPMSYSEIVYNLLALFVLGPALIILAVDARTDFAETDRQIRTSLIRDSERLSLRMETWVFNRKSSIINLAEMAASKSPQQMQPYLELIKKSDVNFLRVGLHDREATTTAYFPLVDELGQSTIGRSFADRPFIAILKQTLKPMLSEISMSKTGKKLPRVLMLAPVVIRGEYGGYVIGALDLQQLREHLDKSSENNTMLFSLTDKNGNIIMSNRTDQRVMTPFVRGKGTLSRLDRISQWIPDQKSDTSPTARWRDSFYVAESSIGNMAEWRLILEQPVAPFQKMLYDNYAGKLTLLFLILIGALVIADLLSRKIVASLGQLRTLTYELPDRLTNVGQEIDWPESGIKEIKQLVNNFRAMANTLSARLVEIRHITEEISESRQQMLDIIDFLPDATFVVDCDKKVIVWNSAMEKMTGVTKTEMLGQGNNAYTIPFYGEKRQNLLDLLEEDNETIAATYKNVLRENNTLSAETFCPALYGGKGAFVWAVVAPLFNMNGDRIGAIESIRDTTERRHTQDALKRAYDEVEMRVCERTVELDASNMALKAEIDKHKQTEAELLVAKEAADSANRAKSEFLTNMSHEIRTPMNGLLGMTQLLEVTELTQEQREYVVALKLSGKTLLSLISDILDLSRIEAGKISIELAEFGLHQCINDIFMMQKSVVFGKGLKLDIDVAGDIPHLLVGDQLRLKQILLNLLGNAVKFTNEGHISISAQLLEQHDAAVLIKISVRDTGVGILPEVLDKIFMPFTQADGSISRKYGGTGLGLTISRRLAELLGGIISVESSPGIGSCFTVTLPFTIGTTTINPQAEPATTSVWDGPPLRILFVEDDPINITFGTSLLKKMGHSVTTAENGRQCLAALEKDTFDIVLMDIQMPLMNGEEAMREIRRQEDGTAVHLPIIALTAYSMRNDKNRLLEDGFDGYVSKPLYIKDILDEMKRVIG